MTRTTAFIALPVPTAWFLYGFWPAQFLVVGLYVLLFDREIVTRRDLDRFREIVARHARSGGSAPRSGDPPRRGRRATPSGARPGGLRLSASPSGPTDPGRGSAPPPAG